MWSMHFKVLWIALWGIAFANGSKLRKEIDSELWDRLDIVEELLASQIESQEVLRVSLRKETERRLALETMLMRSIEEEKVKVEEMTSILKVTSDRVQALDETIQDEIGLREEAEISGKEAINQLTNRVDLVERDLSLLSLLNSRLREIEDQKGIQNEEIFNLQTSLAQIRKSMNRERREIQKVQSSIEPLAYTTSEQSGTLTNLETRIGELRLWLLSHNESAARESALLRDVKTEVFLLTDSLTDIQDSITNLTESVIHLHQLAPTKLLKLCPEGFRKVGEDCLQLMETKSSWEDAQMKCEELGISAGGIGDLVVPTSIIDFRAYVDRLSISETDYLWVGAKRGEDNIWRWVSGVSLEEKEVPWDLGEPDNYFNQIHLCIRTNGNLKFHDCLIDARLFSVCQLT